MDQLPVATKGVRRDPPQNPQITDYSEQQSTFQISSNAAFFICQKKDGTNWSHQEMTPWVLSVCHNSCTSSAQCPDALESTEWNASSQKIWAPVQNGQREKAKQHMPKHHLHHHESSCTLCVPLARSHNNKPKHNTPKPNGRSPILQKQMSQRASVCTTLRQELRHKIKATKTATKNSARVRNKRALMLRPGVASQLLMVCTHSKRQEPSPTNECSTLDTLMR